MKTFRTTCGFTSQITKPSRRRTRDLALSAASNNLPFFSPA